MGVGAGGVHTMQCYEQGLVAGWWAWGVVPRFGVGPRARVRGPRVCVLIMNFERAMLGPTSTSIRLPSIVST